MISEQVVQVAERSAVAPPWRAQVSGMQLQLGGLRVLDGVSLEIRPREIVLLQGENGSGKTTLLNAISGFVDGYRGTAMVNLDGEPMESRRAGPERLARRGLGRLWQDIRLFPNMTALENVLSATSGLGRLNSFIALAGALLARYRVQEARARESAMKNLARVGMESFADRTCDMLSVGQMKRVAIARLLQMNAKLLLLDEPLAGLDAASAEALVKDLDRLRGEDHMAILVVEHRKERIAPIADHSFVLRQGRIERGKSLS